MFVYSNLLVSLFLQNFLTRLIALIPLVFLILLAFFLAFYPNFDEPLHFFYVAKFLVREYEKTYLTQRWDQKNYFLISLTQKI